MCRSVDLLYSEQSKGGDGSMPSGVRVSSLDVGAAGRPPLSASAHSNTAGPGPVSGSRPATQSIPATVADTATSTPRTAAGIAPSAPAQSTSANGVAATNPVIAGGSPAKQAGASGLRQIESPAGLGCSNSRAAACEVLSGVAIAVAVGGAAKLAYDKCRSPYKSPKKSAEQKKGRDEDDASPEGEGATQTVWGRLLGSHGADLQTYGAAREELPDLEKGEGSFVKAGTHTGSAGSTGSTGVGPTSAGTESIGVSLTSAAGAALTSAAADSAGAAQATSADSASVWRMSPTANARLFTPCLDAPLSARAPSMAACEATTTDAEEHEQAILSCPETVVVVKETGGGDNEGGQREVATSQRIN